MVVEVKEEKFSDFVSSNSVVLVDFSATWCGPCKMQGKILEGIEAEYGDKIAVAKVDVDENPNIARTFNVYAVPSLVFFVKGKRVVFDEESGEKTGEASEEETDELSMECSKLVGVQSEELLKKIIDDLISTAGSE
ncbi:MAG: thioredoxin domain-containing protein [Candidatus Freyarchaeum deiterrae]